MHDHMNVKSTVLVTLCILMLRSDSHDNKYHEYCPVECDAVYSG